MMVGEPTDVLEGDVARDLVDERAVDRVREEDGPLRPGRRRQQAGRRGENG